MAKNEVLKSEVCLSPHSGLSAQKPSADFLGFPIFMLDAGLFPTVRDR